jgi:hypothetical protein
MLTATPAQTLTTMSDSTVVYTATSGQTLAMSQCPSAAFDNPDPTRSVVDVNLYNTNFHTALASGYTVFRECVRSTAVLALDDNTFTQAIIDSAATQFAASVPWSDDRVNRICRHHVRRCFLLYDADPSGDGSSPVFNATAQYNLTITFEGTPYTYQVSMSQCGGQGYHDWVANPHLAPALRHCFLHETPMEDVAFHPALQQAEGDPIYGQIGVHGRYAFATSMVCNKQQVLHHPRDSHRRSPSSPPSPPRANLPSPHAMPLWQHVCNAIPENQPLSTGCRAVVPKCRSALKHLKLMMLRDDLLVCGARTRDSPRSGC